MTDTWDLMQTWNLVLPPSRPAAMQLARVRSQIQDLDKSAPVAVLGSTPEFRDMLYECGFLQIYVLERNMSFHRAMSELRIYQTHEYLIKGDWRETLQELKGIFSLILSDLTMGNIPYNDRSLFYNLITEALSKGGLFCDKVLTHVGPNLSFKDLVEKYSTLPLNLLHINYFSCEMLFCSELLDIKEQVDSSLFYAILDERVKHKRVQAFRQQAQKITPPGCIWDYGRSWELLKGTYCPNLEIISIDEDEFTSPYYKRLKFFVFRRSK